MAVALPISERRGNLIQADFTGRPSPNPEVRYDTLPNPIRTLYEIEAEQQWRIPSHNFSEIGQAIGSFQDSIAQLKSVLDPYRVVTDSYTNAAALAMDSVTREAARERTLDFSIPYQAGYNYFRPIVESSLRANVDEMDDQLKTKITNATMAIATVGAKYGLWEYLQKEGLTNDMNPFTAYMQLFSLGAIDVTEIPKTDRFRLHVAVESKSEDFVVACLHEQGDSILTHKWIDDPHGEVRGRGYHIRA